MLPNIEIVSAKVHEAWMQSKIAQGVSTRKAEDGEELMVPYEQLTEKAKELDRGTVRAVYAAIYRPGAKMSEMRIDRRAFITRDWADKSYLISHSLPKRLLFVGAMIGAAIGWVAWEWVRYA